MRAWFAVLAIACFFPGRVYGAEAEQAPLKKMVGASFSFGGGSSDKRGASSDSVGFDGSGHLEFLLGRFGVGPWIDGDYTTTLTTSTKGTERERSSSLGIGPMCSFFFGDVRSEQIVPNINVGLGVGEYHTRRTTDHHSDYVTAWAAGGLLVFISRDIAIDNRLRLSTTTYGDDQPTKSIRRSDFMFGLSTFL